ncbi:MAG: sugar kinase [Spirochaetia bacterium]|nr:sugar kinase [Spirochaetia bacterium]
MKSRVVTIGESLVAFIPNAHTKLRYVQQFSKVVVGAESNVAVGLAKLGIESSWVSKVGNDEFGQFIIRELRAEGVDTSQVKLSNDNPTAIMFKQFSANLDSSVFYYRNGSAASTLALADIDLEYLRQAKLLHLSGITPALSDSCKQTVIELFRFAKQEGILISFDPNIRRKLWSEEEAKKTLKPLLLASDIALLGEDEGELLLGTSDAQQISKLLLASGVRSVGVKQGSRGSSVADASGFYQIDPYPVKVVDTIGAGDAFNAGFLTGFLEGKPIKECGLMGSLMGGLAVSSYGDTEGLPDRSTFDRLLAQKEEIHR